MRKWFYCGQALVFVSSYCMYVWKVYLFVMNELGVYVMFCLIAALNSFYGYALIDVYVYTQCFILTALTHPSPFFQGWGGWMNPLYVYVVANIFLGRWRRLTCFKGWLYYVWLKRRQYFAFDKQNNIFLTGSFPENIYMFIYQSLKFVSGKQN